MMTIHTLACAWVWIGNREPFSWINNEGSVLIGADDATLYITALYWVTTTLATVGYGDIKGRCQNEYVYVMFVEFVGIIFFSFIMGSISSIIN